MVECQHENVGPEPGQQSQVSGQAERTEPRPPICFSVRYMIATLLFFGGVVGYAMRVNMNIAIVAMTDNETNPSVESFDWTNEEMNIILSSYFWGYVVTQLPSGILAQRYGAKWILLWGMLLAGVCSVLTPPAAYFGGWRAVCLVRGFQGLAQATFTPCVYALIAKWASPEERGSIMAFAYSGDQLGIIMTLPLSALIATSPLGWPYVFYIFGCCGLVWCLFWLFLSSSSPTEHTFIQEMEQNYLAQHLSEKTAKNKMATPWKYIFTSVPLLAIVVAHLVYNWGFWTLQTETPIFMKTVLHFDLKNNGLLSALPYLSNAILVQVIGFVGDICVKRKYMTLSFARKFFNSIGFLGPAAALIVLPYVPQSQTAWIVLLLVLSVCLNSGVYVGFLVNYIDLSPNFASVMIGVTNTLANCMGIIVPIAVGKIVVHEGSIEEWKIVFWIAAGLYIFGNTVYVLFASGDLQPWDSPDYNKTVSTQTLVNAKEKDGNSMNVTEKFPKGDVCKQRNGRVSDKNFYQQ